MRWSSKFIVALVLGIAACGGWWLSLEDAPRTAGPMPHDVYVWQRAWTGETQRAVAGVGSQFGTLLVLHAEVSWPKGRWKVARVPVDFTALSGTGRPIGVVLRIGPYSGRFASDDVAAGSIVRLARDMLSEARAAGVAAAEFQLDFDCAESKLDGYHAWVRAVRAAVAPTPLTITALPCWLDRAAFAELAAETDGYVLQVHAIQRPSGPDDAVTLCDPGDARRAVDRAARFGRPFRVALPTNRYECAFDGAGRMIGLRAEGRRRRWPEGTQLRELGADPSVMAELVAEWTRDRPACCRGVVWFRLPVATDEMNWSAETLVSVMRGRTPAAAIRATARTTTSGLTEIVLLNQGDADGSILCSVAVRRAGRKIVAADGLAGYQWRETGNGGVAFDRVDSERAARLRPGEDRQIGWIRWDSDTEVQIDVETKP